jgi:predicted amidophosphoribosyltransferase
MPGSEIDWEARRTLHFRLCLCCFRAVPATTSEQYCINDGTPMLEACPSCATPITSPYARFCAACGLEFTRSVREREANQG